MDSPFYVITGFQEDVSRYVLADSEEKARIISSEFNTWPSGYAQLRYEVWSFANNSLSNREFREIEVNDPEGFCNGIFNCLIFL